MEGAGTAGVWGFSPAIDMLSLADMDHSQQENAQDANILLMGGRDARHIIKTIAHLGRHKNFTGNLNFYVYEEQAPMLARTILLLSIFLDQDPNINNGEQSQFFLEVFGNTFLRGKSYDAVKSLATSLIILLGDSKGPLASLFNLNLLKFRDRDDLEVVFKFWRDDVKKAYDIEKLWDTRLRRLYGPRYDCRENSVDWDYHMKLVKEVTIIHKTEFLRWRQHGIAYEVRGSSYDKPNRTTATLENMKQDGVKVVKWGYFNDVITGPFIPFGIETENELLLKRDNDMHKHASSEVAEFNIAAYLEEYKKTFPTVDLLLSRVKIHLLPPGADPTASLLKLTKKSKTAASMQFTSIFVSNSTAQCIAQIPPALLGPKTRMSVETARFMLDLKATQVQAFTEKLVEVCIASGFRMLNCGNNAESSSKESKVAGKAEAKTPDVLLMGFAGSEDTLFSSAQLSSQHGMGA
ncbi:Dynein assembly factor 3, axonemal [Chytriomyces hyalinus]|nr:Dynein assembly factor 3, axonemal [Chytriomyces hyalinus]